MAGTEAGKFFEQRGLKNWELYSFPDTSQLSPQTLNGLQQLGFPKQLTPQLPLIVCDQRANRQTIVLQDNPEPTLEENTTYGKPVYLKIKGIPELELAVLRPYPRETVLKIKQGSISGSVYLGFDRDDPWGGEFIAVIALKDSSDGQVSAEIHSITGKTGWREPSSEASASIEEINEIQVTPIPASEETPVKIPVAEKPQPTPMEQVRADCRRLLEKLRQEQAKSFIPIGTRGGIYSQENRELILNPDEDTPIYLISNPGFNGKTLMAVKEIDGQPVLEVLTLEHLYAGDARIHSAVYGPNRSDGNKQIKRGYWILQPTINQLKELGVPDHKTLPEDVNVMTAIRRMLKGFGSGSLELPDLVAKKPAQIVRDRLTALLEEQGLSQEGQEIELIKPIIEANPHVAKVMDNLPFTPLIINLTGRQLYIKPKLIVDGKSRLYYEYLQVNFNEVLPDMYPMIIANEELPKIDQLPIFVLTREGPKMIMLNIPREVLNQAFEQAHPKPEPVSTTVYSSKTAQKSREEHAHRLAVGDVTYERGTRKKGKSRTKKK